MPPISSVLKSNSCGFGGPPQPGNLWVFSMAVLCCTKVMTYFIWLLSWLCCTSWESYCCTSGSCPSRIFSRSTGVEWAFCFPWNDEQDINRFPMQENTGVWSEEDCDMFPPRLPSVSAVLAGKVSPIWCPCLGNRVDIICFWSYTVSFSDYLNQGSG